jgi:subtilisin family serine protease
MSQNAILTLDDRAQEARSAVSGVNANILAEYAGAFLIRASEEALGALSAQGWAVREVSAPGTVRLGACRVHTDKAEASATTAAARNVVMAVHPHLAGNMAAADTHLVPVVVRLSGPLCEAWERSLKNFGAVLDEQVEENVWLVTAPAGHVDAVQALPFVEGVAPYEAAAKIAPALATPAVRDGLAPSAAGEWDMEAIEQTAAHVAAAAQPIPAPPAAGPAVRPDFPHRRALTPSEAQLEIVLFHEADMAAVSDAVRAAGGAVRSAEGKRLVVAHDETLLGRIAVLPQVKSISIAGQYVLHNNVATGIMKADVLHSVEGLTGAGQIVAVGDTGLDTGVDDATMHDDFRGRIAGFTALGRPGDASDLDGHGTHVAGSVLGNGSASNQTVRGLAPRARLFFISVADSDGILRGIPNDLSQGYFDFALNAGAQIQTNSWGEQSSDPQEEAALNGRYGANSTDADKFCFANRTFLVLFSAGNSGDSQFPKARTPGTAKNVLTVGASESLRPLPASVSFPNGGSINGLSSQADNIADVADFSSIGPVQNNRRKPDVVAPGTWILSTRSSVCVADNGPDGFPDSGDEDGLKTHAEAVGRGLPSRPLFGSGNANAPALPAGVSTAAQLRYMYESGTSMATPLTAGACALIREYLITKRNLPNPSAALIKALMVNGAVDMGQGVPNNRQGWGRVDLVNTINPASGIPIQFDDQLSNAVGTGQIRRFDVSVTASGFPLAVTLVWRDPAGATIQNRLHLRLIPPGGGQALASDPVNNIRNNVQKVIVPNPATGTWKVEVEGVNIGTGVPEFAPAKRQDFALAVANGRL